MTLGEPDELANGTVSHNGGIVARKDVNVESMETQRFTVQSSPSLYINFSMAGDGPPRNTRSPGPSVVPQEEIKASRERMDQKKRCQTANSRYSKIQSLQAKVRQVTASADAAEAEYQRAMQESQKRITAYECQIEEQKQEMSALNAKLLEMSLRQEKLEESKQKRQEEASWRINELTLEIHQARGSKVETESHWKKVLDEEKHRSATYKEEADRKIDQLTHEIIQARADSAKVERQLQKEKERHSTSEVQREASEDNGISKVMFEEERCAPISERITRDTNAPPTKRPDIMILVMGTTGTGKSALIQLMTGNTNIKIGYSVQSETTEIGYAHYFEADGRCVTLVDTPSFDNSHGGMTDDAILKEIAAFLDSVQRNRKVVLGGIIYVHRITDRDPGITGIRVCEKVCGLHSLKSVIVVTTRWDEIQESTGVRRESELMNNRIYFGTFTSRGAQFCRHSNTTESVRHIMDRILHLYPIRLQIQNELSQGVTLEKTAAGSVICVAPKANVVKERAGPEDVRQGEMESVEDTFWAKERDKLRQYLEERDAEKLSLEKGLHRPTDSEVQENEGCTIETARTAEGANHAKGSNKNGFWIFKY